MAQKYSVQDRVWITKQKYLLSHNVSIQRLWRKQRNTPPPDSKTINALFSKWEESGSVCDAPRSGRPVSVTSAEAKNAVQQHFADHPSTSARRTSQQLDIPRRSLARLIKQLGLRHYIPRLVQELNEDDYDRRLQFCEEMLRKVHTDDQLVSHIIWSDEAHFKIDGTVNRHNAVYYASENPHLKVTRAVATPGLTVWAGIHAAGVIGPFITRGTVNGERYLAMLETQFWPALTALPNYHRYVFQHDGAPPHWSRAVRDWLDEHFPNRWIGRRGNYLEWPPRSPDLTVCDFFLWGYIKNKVYATRIRNLDELEQAIVNAFHQLQPDVIGRACETLPSRLQDCINADGSHFEHLN